MLFRDDDAALCWEHGVAGDGTPLARGLPFDPPKFESNQSELAALLGEAFGEAELRPAGPPLPVLAFALLLLLQLGVKVPHAALGCGLAPTPAGQESEKSSATEVKLW